jgi:hypothetical protein
VFELQGGVIRLENGWNDGPSEDKGARWEPSEVDSVMQRLMAARPAQKKVWGT